MTLSCSLDSKELKLHNISFRSQTFKDAAERKCPDRSAQPPHFKDKKNDPREENVCPQATLPFSGLLASHPIQRFPHYIPLTPSFQCLVPAPTPSPSSSLASFLSHIPSPSSSCPQLVFNIVHSTLGNVNKRKL